MYFFRGIYFLLYALHTPFVFAKDWSSLAFQVERSTSRTLTDSKGDPVFWQADTAWEIFHRLNSTEVELYLADRAAKNFNVIYGTILAEEDGFTVPNQNGDLPFIDYDPTMPNEPYFQWIDSVIEKSGNYGITIALAPAWGRWVNEGWHGSPVVLNISNAAKFGKYIGQRYAGLPKIIGGDSNRYVKLLSPLSLAEVKGHSRYHRWWFHKQGMNPQPTDKALKIIDSGPVFNELAYAIHHAEACELRGHGIHPFMTYHGTNVWFSAFPDSTASAMYGNQTWLSMDGVQTGHSDINSSQVPRLHDIALPAMNTKLSLSSVEFFLRVGLYASMGSHSEPKRGQGDV